MIADTDPVVLQRAAELLIAQHGFTGIHATVLRADATHEAKTVASLARMAHSYAILSPRTMHMLWRDMQRFYRAEAHGWHMNLRPQTCGWEDAVGVSTERLRYIWRIERKQQRRFAQRIARALGQEVR